MRRAGGLLEAHRSAGMSFLQRAALTALAGAATLTLTMMGAAGASESMALGLIVPSRLGPVAPIEGEYLAKFSCSSGGGGQVSATTILP
jgi:hypothetical protein